MVGLLEPVFSYCEEILYYAWFTFLHGGRAIVRPYKVIPVDQKK